MFVLIAMHIFGYIGRQKKEGYNIENLVRLSLYSPDIWHYPGPCRVGAESQEHFRESELNWIYSNIIIIIVWKYRKK